MNEWFYVTEGGHIINACITSKPYGPTIVLTTPGKWVRDTQVSQAALEAYEFWDVRP